MNEITIKINNPTDVLGHVERIEDDFVDIGYHVPKDFVVSFNDFNKKYLKLNLIIYNDRMLQDRAVKALLVEYLI